MSINLTAAFSQWASRPADERFASLEAMREALALRTEQSRTASVPFGSLRIVPHEGSEKGIALNGSTGKTAGLTNWSFGQICSRVGAPASYLETLPREKVVDLLTYGVAMAEEQEKIATLLIDLRGGIDGLMIRALNSPIYGRLWDSQIVEECLRLRDQGWRVPPARPALPNQPGTRPATEEDVLTGGKQFGLSINVGDLIAPAGLYAGDRDSFIFMVNEQRRVEDGQAGLARGFFSSNSEVGARNFTFTSFFYDSVCGNHIVWGAKSIKRIKVRHVGSAAQDAFREMRVKLIEYMESSDRDDALRVKKAQTFRIATGKEDVIAAVFRAVGIPKKTIGRAYDRAITDARFDPDTAWGLASGLTANSQEERNADRRAAIDEAAGRVVEMAF